MDQNFCTHKKIVTGYLFFTLAFFYLLGVFEIWLPANVIALEPEMPGYLSETSLARGVLLKAMRGWVSR
jgi:hypothetical protein